jgi:hypothetical protein
MSFTQTLVLCNSYRPHKVVDWKTAVTSMLNGKVEVISEYDEILAVLSRKSLSSFPELERSLRQVIGTSAESLTIRVPAVVVNTRPVRAARGGVKYGKRNIYIRDKFTCQYCNTKYTRSDLNLDHVIPKSRDGKTTWTNIVTACIECNSMKRDRTPDEAGMKLLRPPRRPVSLPSFGPLIDAQSAPVEWQPFLVAA